MTKTSRAPLASKSSSNEKAGTSRKRSPRKGTKHVTRKLVSKYVFDEREQEMLDAEAIHEIDLDDLRGIFDSANYLLNGGMTEDWETDFGTYRIDYGKRH
ncbi:hypothetical protein [Rhizobium sp. 1399]|uniref:hypothetical protein n=1 Tax=Rhizobium sp. 1399 TaxID=2817758 RepID=UPI0028587796|nr:hypothetical protein [Rhizobium sp. 1399]MDR6667073.1 hypothetical protein [Rhizobium sp. 1399]